MKRVSTKSIVERSLIESGVSSILQRMTAKWERAFETKIGPETRLAADLGLESIQLVQLVEKVEKHFKIKNIPFHRLLLSDENASFDLTVANVVDFLDRVLNDPDAL